MADKIALEIKPHVGINDLLFGKTRQDAQSAFGKPDETETIESGDGEYKTEVWHYWKKGFSLFFDENVDYRFTCVEIDNRSATIWETPVFMLSETEIIDLFKSKGYKDIDSEVHEWGERRISFDDALVDLYFENNKLVSVNYGVLNDGNENRLMIFPN
ncbi:MAG: hypothetical protein AB1458_11335 [Bacteroidota bacterium]